MTLGLGIIIPILPFYVEQFGGGGKVMVMVGILGNAIIMIILGFSNSLWMLYLSRGLAGLLPSATLPTSMAFISDSTSECEPGGGMGFIGAAMGLGMVLGPV